MNNSKNHVDAARVFSSASTEEEKALKAELLRSVLPGCQPQEGSPANTFTESEIQTLSAALPHWNIRPREDSSVNDDNGKKMMMDIRQDWMPPEPCPQEAPQELDWYGAPKIDADSVAAPRAFREECRNGRHTGPTNGVCPGFLQCNLVVLPEGKHAFDFLLFCQRNPKACPLIEVCDVGSWNPIGVAPGADLRTDCPK